MASSKAYSDDQSGPTKHRPRTSADVRGRCLVGPDQSNVFKKRLSSVELRLNICKLSYFVCTCN